MPVDITTCRNALDLLLKRGLEQDSYSASHLIRGFAASSSLDDAYHVFSILPIPNIFAWSAIIDAHTKHGLPHKALSLFTHLHAYTDIRPDAHLFVVAIKACSALLAKGLHKARSIHSQVVEYGYAGNTYIGSALIDMYVKCGHMVDAQHIFDFMPIKDCVTWNTLLVGYSNGSSEQVFGIFERMKKEGISPDDVSFLTILSVCCHLGLVDDGKKYYEEMRSKYGIDPTIKHKACIVELLCNVGQLDVAAEMAQEESNIVAWTSVLDACRAWGNLELGKESFHFAVRDKS